MSATAYAYIAGGAGQEGTQQANRRAFDYWQIVPRMLQDVFKALALGATAVGLGRPFAFALALGGEDVVVEVIENTLAELDLTMAFADCRNLQEVREHPLKRAPDAIASCR